VGSILKPATVAVTAQANESWPVGLLSLGQTLSFEGTGSAIRALSAKWRSAILPLFASCQPLPCWATQFSLLIESEMASTESPTVSSSLPAGNMAFDLAFIEPLMNRIMMLCSVGGHRLGVGINSASMHIHGGRHLGVLMDIQWDHAHSGDDVVQAVY
jgi:hypothetical protein